MKSNYFDAALVFLLLSEPKERFRCSSRLRPVLGSEMLLFLKVEYDEGTNNMNNNGDQLVRHTACREAALTRWYGLSRTGSQPPAQ